MRAGLMWNADLVVYQGIVNVFHQVINPLHILRVVEKLHRIILSSHQLLANLLQLPVDPSPLCLALNFEE